MSDNNPQDILLEAWLGGKEGTLCGREQARVWALREQWRENHTSDHGMNSYIAGKVRKTKNGRPEGPHPDRTAIAKLFEKIDEEEDDWFPGKFSSENMGRKRVLAGGKLNAVCKSAKTVKKELGDVTFPLVAARARNALTNPDTGKFVDKSFLHRDPREVC